MERPGAMTLRGNPFTLIGPELKVGDKAPEFEAIDGSLKPVHLSDTGSKVRVFNVVPSLDMDLPFAQKRWCGAFGVDKVKMVSDHREGSFGSAFGTLIKELRIHARAIFVLDKDNTIRHVEYVKEMSEHPNYDSVMAAVKTLA